MTSPHLTTVALHVDLSTVSGKLEAALRALRGLPGVASAEADVIGGALVVTFDCARTTVAALVGSLAAQGLPASRAHIVEDGTASTAE